MNSIGLNGTSLFRPDAASRRFLTTPKKSLRLKINTICSESSKIKNKYAKTDINNSKILSFIDLMNIVNEGCVIIICTISISPTTEPKAWRGVVEHWKFTTTISTTRTPRKHRAGYVVAAFFSTITLGPATQYLGGWRWQYSESRIHGRSSSLRDGKVQAVGLLGTSTIRKEMAHMWKVARHFNIFRLPARRRRVPGLLPLKLWTAGTRGG